MHSIAQQYSGLVLAEREQNLRDDSYFHLTVWDPEELKQETFVYAATAWPSTPLHPETVQTLIKATPAGVHHARDAAQDRAKRAAAVELLQMQLQRGDAFKGDRVRVARGRKVPRGIEGRVISVFEKVTHTSKYGTWQTRETFAMIDGDKGVWTVRTDHLDIVERGPVVQELFDLSC